MGPFSIAIDGPAGAGKSSVAKLVAIRTGAVYLDTGAMYRAVGLYMRQREIDLKDAARVAEASSGAVVDIQYVDGAQRVFLCGEDVTDRIRRPEISAAASLVAAVPEVRKRMVAAQREIARTTSVIMDGRDIGTKVLPSATLKIYLTADVRERARRRYDELRAMSVCFNQVLRELMDRDNADRTREESPLRKAEDAIELDTTDMSQEQAASRIIELLGERLGEN